MYISFKNTTIEILFFSRKSKFYFWTATTSATSALEKFHTRQVLMRFVKKDSFARKRLLDKSRRQKRHVYGRQIIPKHYPIPFSTFVRDK